MIVATATSSSFTKTLMPRSRVLEQRIKNRRQSTRIASSAIKTAVGELTPKNQALVKSKGLGTTRAVITVGGDSLALATQPAITFATKSSGKLATQDVRGTARHEVAHFSLPGGSKGTFPTIKQTSAQHFAIGAAGAKQGTSPQSGLQLRNAAKVAKQSFERQVSHRRKRITRRSSTSSTSVRPEDR